MVDLAVRPALILAFAWLVTRCLSKATPATRHLVWHTAVIAVLAAPILLPLTPKFVAPIPLNAERANEMVATLAQRFDYVPSTQSTSGTSRTSSTLGTSTPGTLGTLIPLFYLLSSLIVVAWFACGWLLTVITVRRAAPAPDEWRLEANALCAKLRIQRLVDVRVHSGIGTPVVAGLKRTVVVLPTTAGDWDEERRRSVLLHELAHVRRGDLRSQALAQIACAVYWFNPLVWLAASHLRAERERACDDEVLRSGMRPSAYAQHLLEIAKGLRGSHLPPAALAMTRATQLEGRLLAVLSADRHRTPARWTRWAVTLGISVVSIALVGATPVGPPVARPSAALLHAGWLLPQDVPTPAERLEARKTAHAAATTLATSADPEVREDAVMRLAASNAENYITALERALSDPSRDVREKAALALGLMSTPDVIPSLLEAMSDADAQVREKAAIGLALRRDDRVTEALLQAMNDDDAQVREKVVIALGTSGDARAKAALDRALSDPDGQVREKAATGLILLDRVTPTNQQADSVRAGLRGVLGAVIAATKAVR